MFTFKIIKTSKFRYKRDRLFCMMIATQSRNGNRHCAIYIIRVRTYWIYSESFLDHLVRISLRCNLRGRFCGRQGRNFEVDVTKLKKAAAKRKSQFLMDSYRQVRNKVNVLNIQLKKQYYINKISACQGNMKESWKAINELLNKRSKSCNIDCLKESGAEIVHKKDISNAMNSFFCSVGKNLADKIDPAPNPLLEGDYEVNKRKARFSFRTIEVQEIRDAFATVKTAKSFGTDKISSYFLKLAQPFIENSLAFLLNTSIETSRFPDSWKVARVTPIFKEGDKAEKSNYRPISVLPVISRLFEKLVTNQLYPYMNDNGHFSPGQSCFLRLHSTVTLLKNTDDWYNGMDLGKLVGLVFIDLKKAFDTVDHNILCEKFEPYGVQQRELSWFKSYLSNRKNFAGLMVWIQKLGT